MRYGFLDDMRTPRIFSRIFIHDCQRNCGADFTRTTSRTYSFALSESDLMARLKDVVLSLSGGHLMGRATGSFELTSWNEETYFEAEGRKMTLATVTQSFSGDITGDGAVRWLMAYRDDGTARFVGMQRVDGTLDGRSGSFVLETEGDFDGRMARWTATVMPGSGADELAGLEGAGTFGAEHGPSATYEIDYQLPQRD